MKNFLSLLCILFWMISNLQAQITIQTADLSHANDTFRLSTAQLTTGIDVNLTGPSYVWDFSQLMPASQRVDSFIDEASTSTIFSFVFIDNGFNTNRANQATRSNGFNLGATISLSDVFNFFYNSSASYKQVGFGANVNGIPLPITFSPHDMIYKLPLQFSAIDSSTSGYVVDLASTIGIYYKVNKTRKNQVDGWGSLTTPFGTFNTLRVHSTIVEKDSIYLDTLGFGFNLPPITTHEYKWLGNAQGVPLLQINTGATGAINSIVYKDSRRSLIGIEKVILNESSFNLYPNPASQNMSVQFELNIAARVEIEIISMDGKILSLIEPKLFAQGSHDLSFNIADRNLSAGNFLLRLQINEKKYLKPLLISPSK